MIMKETVIVYGVGKFYELHKKQIHKDYFVCGYVDRKFKTEIIKSKKCFSSIDEININYEKILVMCEKVELIFEFILNLKCYHVLPEIITLGISDFGHLSKYFSFSVDEAYRIKVQDKYGIEYVDDKEEFVKCLNNKINIIVNIYGEKLKNDLRNLYEEKMNIMCMDRMMRCMDHDIDVYFRYERMGYFNWGNTATFSLMAIKKYEKPYILDLGCGDAFYYRHLYKYIEGVRYIGCDIDDDNIKSVCEKEKDAEFIIANVVTDMPVPKEKSFFDVITWNGSFSVFNDDEQINIINSAKSRLGENGIFVVSDFYSKKRKPEWYYSINAVHDEYRLRDLFKKYFANIYIYVCEKDEAFYLLAFDGDLPAYNLID